MSDWVYHVKITPKELMFFFSVSPLSERFSFCHSQTQLRNASQKGVSTVYIIIRGQFVGVNKPSRLNAYRYHCAEGLALQCFSFYSKYDCVIRHDEGVVNSALLISVFRFYSFNHHC